MTLLSPVALACLALAIPVIALFRYQRRAVNVEVPTLVFWQMAVPWTNHGGFGRRIARWLSLLIHLLVVGLLALALARPTFDAVGDEIVILLDDSATMQTRESEQATRFDLARLEVARLLDELPQDARIHVLLTGTPPMMLRYDRAGGRAAIRSAIDAHQPRDVNPATFDAIDLARRVVSSEATAILITDMHGPHPEPESVAQLIAVGRQQPNRGIASVVCSEDGRLSVSVTQRGFTGSATVVRVEVAGRIVASRDVRLQGNTAQVEFSPGIGGGTAFEVLIDSLDGLALDNRFYGVWPTRETVSVQLVSTGNPWLQAALSLPGIDLVMTDRWTRADSSVVVMDAPAGGLGQPVDGRFLVLGGEDPFGVVRFAGAVDGLRATQWAPQSPFLADIDVMSWRMQTTAGWQPPADAQVLVQSGKTPLLFVVRRQEPNLDFAALYLNCDVRASSIHRDASLALLVWNALEVFSPARSRDLAPAHATGSPMRLSLGTSDGCSVEAPSGEQVTTYEEDGQVVVPATSRAGFYRVASAGGVRLQAVSYFPEPASPASGPLPDRAAVFPGGRFVAAVLSSPRWLLVVLGALVIVVVEALLYRFGLARID